MARWSNGLCWSVMVLGIGLTASGQETGRPEGVRPLQQLVLPEGTTVEKDVPYVKGGHDRQKLDLYLPPAKGNSKRPLVVWIHGGGWKQGNKDRTPAIAVTREGVAVASINYRLSQDAPFPAQIQDCQAAIRWLKGNADKYGIDANRIVVWGASAGGHLVALVGTASDTMAWEPIGEFKDLSPRVQGVIDWFGPADFDLWGPSVARENDALAPLLGNPSEATVGEKLKVISPVTYVTRDDPPFLIVHGNEDRLVPIAHSERLHDRLQKAGVSSKLVVIERSGHGGPQFLDEKQRETLREFLRNAFAEAK